MADELGADGCGILHYASGKVLAIVSRVNGAKYSQFFDDSEKDSKRVQILAAFNFAGIGFANYRSGAHRLVTTASGVLLLSEDGAITQEHVWDKTSDDTPLPAPIEFNLNGVLAFRCASRASIEITLRRTRHSVFQVGKHKSRSDTYLDKIVARRVDGTLVLDIDPPTLVQRQVEFQGGLEDPVKKAQKHNWTLPRLSASGREVERVHPREHLENVMASHNALIARLHTYATAISETVSAETTLQRSIPTHSFFSPINKPCFVPSHKIKRPAVAPKQLPRLHPKFLDRFLAQNKSTQLVVVLCSDLSTADCIKAEKMLAKIEGAWRDEEAPPDAPPPAESTTDSPKRGGYADPAPERSQSSRRIILVDCATSTLLARRFNFAVYPMYLIYYGGQLGFCGNTFNGFGKSEADFHMQVKTTLRHCQRNQFLPREFQFP
ncbi:Aste57867_20256 [Aphanomyces stellatus]|uniref:Aste57867_20256 protein n=1 Tax=Aphanomyces stellatus TaxID=120398 RepID=A0A485LF53_9STRA|nr:hypothetical protein As57867_020190 [Aphanomyces stellatus]VFT96946.1 Aste57867_20256 [Aphanomyces stellatus]